MGTHATSTELAAFLARYGILAERFEHPPVMTVEESERLVPRLAGPKTKNLCLRDKKGGRQFLVTVPHDLAVDLHALGTAIGAGRIGFASPERLRQHLGIAPGSVSLLALVNDTARAVELFIDCRLWNADANARAPSRQHRDDGAAACRTRTISGGDRAFATYHRGAGP